MSAVVRSLQAAVVVVLLLLALAGCGDGATGPGAWTPSAPVATQEFLPGLVAELYFDKPAMQRGDSLLVRLEIRNTRGNAASLLHHIPFAMIETNHAGERVLLRGTENPSIGTMERLEVPAGASALAWAWTVEARLWHPGGARPPAGRYELAVASNLAEWWDVGEPAQFVFWSLRTDFAIRP